MLLVGRVLDSRYRIEQLLSRGGQGAAYRATQLAVGRPVAVKVMHADADMPPSARRRFEHEARLVSRLEHPHAVRLYDFGTAEDGTPYLVTELLDGHTPGEELRRLGRVPPARAVSIATQLLKALAEAHELGLVRRDLKPDNIFLKATRGEGDFVKVLDFGIARDEVRPAGLTHPGSVVGTPEYMSPEQACGGPLDGRSDLYTVGVLLHCMLSGSRPFTGRTPTSLLLQHLSSRPPRLGPDVAPVAVADIVEDCPQKSPDARPRSADILRIRLETTAHDIGHRRPDTLPGRSRQSDPRSNRSRRSDPRCDRNNRAARRPDRSRGGLPSRRETEGPRPRSRAAILLAACALGLGLLLLPDETTTVRLTTGAADATPAQVNGAAAGSTPTDATSRVGGSTPVNATSRVAGSTPMNATSRVAGSTPTEAAPRAAARAQRQSIRPPAARQAEVAASSAPRAKRPRAATRRRKPVRRARPAVTGGDTVFEVRAR